MNDLSHDGASGKTERLLLLRYQRASRPLVCSFLLHNIPTLHHRLTMGGHISKMSSQGYLTAAKFYRDTLSNGGAKEGKTSIEEEVAALLPIKAYKSLPSTTRPLFIQMIEE